MSLQTFRLLPRGHAGWSSSSLKFGKNTTVLLGPNGSGKTPLIKALVYCLGSPVELPPLVRDRCRAAMVTILADDGQYVVERRLEPGVDVTITNPSGLTNNLQDERALSAWVLSKLGVSLRVLFGKNGDTVSPYMSVVGPMFLVDQDIGWTAPYVPFESHQFVKDQREEVARWLLDVPARNRATGKSEFQTAKIRLASVQEQISFKRHALEVLQRELGEDGAPDAAKYLQERMATLEAELVRAHSVLETLSKTDSALDVRVREAVERRDQIAFRLDSVKRRKAQLIEVQAEVGAELGALEQNEIAAEGFRSLCGNQACMFFRNPDESYGRRVLYLKDQLKDFEFSKGETEREFVQLEQQLATAESAVQQAVEEKKRDLERPRGAAAVDAVQAMSRELADVRVRIDRLERITREVQNLNTLINNELRVAEEVDELRPTRGPHRDNARLLDARQILASTIKEWLLALRTPNVETDVAVDEELRLVVAGEVFSSRSSHSGSTRTRLVLAYHAALLETSLAMDGVHPHLLVLDAPRQHELHASDLRSYIERFYAMSVKQKQPVQLVFSTTDQGVIPDGRVDSLWEPQFDFGGNPRFLGPLAAPPTI